MTRRLTSLLALVAVLSLTLFASAAQANDDSAPVTPLGDEPSPLLATDSGRAVSLYQDVPDVCTVTTELQCVETLDTWACPAGLSADAKERKLSEEAYNGTIQARAYLDTHCVFQYSSKISPETHRKLRYPDAPALRCTNINGVVDCRNVDPGLTPIPTATPLPTAPTPSFTG